MSLSKLLKIPAVQSFLISGDIFDVLEGVCKKFNLPPARAEEFLDLCDAVIGGDLPLEQMPALLAQAFGVQEDIAKKISADVIGYRLLPLANFIPGVEAEIIALGGKISDYPALRITKDETTDRIELKDLTDGLQIPLTDVLLKRLTFLLQQFAKGDKTEESLKTFFTRSLNIGGLGLTEAQATALLAATLPHAKELTEVTAIVPKGEEGEVKLEIAIAPAHELVAEVPVVSAPKSSGRKQTTPLIPSLKKEGQQPDPDPNELKASARRASVVRKLTEPTKITLAAVLASAAQAAAPVLKKKKISEKVFTDLADKALRGLRDVYQTRDIAERDWELKGDDLAAVMQAITAGIETYQSSSAFSKPVEASDKQNKSLGSEAEIDQRFSELTDTDAGKIEPAKAELTVGSTSLKAANGQRKMVDVVSSARLAGPIEQLGKMTSTEFRRLSSNAAEAGQKIEDLLSALQATSYEDRVKGVLAWRESPINQLYLQIAEEALSQGLALPEVSSRRRAAGKDSLSPAEIKALALLNAKIRF